MWVTTHQSSHGGLRDSRQCALDAGGASSPDRAGPGGGWPLLRAAERPVLAVNSETVSRPGPPGPADDGPAVASAVVPESVPGPVGAADRSIAIHPAVGSAPDRLSTWVFPARRSGECWPGMGCRCYITWIRAPSCRSANRTRPALSRPDSASWSTSILRGRAN